MQQSEPIPAASPAADDATRRPPVSRARGRPSLTICLLLPALLFLAIFFAYPMVDIVIRSFAGPVAWRRSSAPRPQSPAPHAARRFR